MAENLSLPIAKRRRGVAISSITRLEKHVIELEAKEKLSHKDEVAIKGFIKRLENLDADFKGYHCNVIDLVEEDEAVLLEEQAKLDDHEDRVTDLMSRLLELGVGDEKIVTPSVAGSSKPLEKRLGSLANEVRTINGKISSLAPGPDFDLCLAQHLAESISELKSELVDISRGLSLLESDDTTLSEWALRIKESLSDLGLRLKRLQFDQASGTPSAGVSGIKLPKLEVPTFDGNIMNWAAFWERFDALIHSKKEVGDAEKLTYLRQALKDGPARHVIGGLSQTAKNYEEAIKCLQERYDRPRLIHQAHVRAIIEAPSLKDGNGRELRRLHDIANQHMRAIKAMEYSPWTFVTSILELKLDQTTMFEWQKHSQGSKEVPDFNELLEFLDLRARATENAREESERKHSSIPSSKKTTSKPSYAVSADEACVVCKMAKHPLYACEKFKTLPHQRMLAIVREHDLCMNCLRPGHFLKQCPSGQKCKKCSKPHHSWLHVDVESRQRTQSPAAEKEKTTTIQTSSFADETELSGPSHDLPD